MSENPEGGSECCSKLWRGDLPLSGIGTFDVLQAVDGDVLVEKMALYSTTTALLITSVSIQTNTANPFTFLSAANGLLSNLLIGRQITATWNQMQPVLLRQNEKITYSTLGLLGSGNIRAIVQWRQVIPGTGSINP